MLILRDSEGIPSPSLAEASAVKHMRSLGILEEITGKQRDRLFVYDEYLKILNEGTEPIGRS